MCLMGILVALNRRKYTTVFRAKKKGEDGQMAHAAMVWSLAFH